MTKLLHIWVNYKYARTKPWFVDEYLEHNRQFFDEVVAVNDKTWDVWLRKAMQHPVVRDMFRRPGGNSRFDTYRTWYLMEHPYTWCADADLKISYLPDVDPEKPAFATFPNGRRSGFFQYSGNDYLFWENMLKRMSEFNPGHTAIQEVGIPQDYPVTLPRDSFFHNSNHEPHGRA